MVDADDADADDEPDVVEEDVVEELNTTGPEPPVTVMTPRMPDSTWTSQM